MGWSLNIGSVAGTAIRIHVTFLLFLAWIFGVSYVSGGAAAAWSGLLFMVLLFLCVLLHEFGHIFTARRFGVMTPDVILLPIGGVARLERIPEKPSEEFLIAIAGPAVNMAIAALLVLFAGANLDPSHFVSIESDKVGLAERLAIVNVFLALFNLIPAFPMDGGRKAENLPGELVHRFGELDIELRQSAGIVCREGYIDGFVDIGPFRVMVELFRNQSGARHKPERFVEVLEYKFPGDGIVPRHFAPALELGQRRLACFAGEFFSHICTPSQRLPQRFAASRYNNARHSQIADQFLPKAHRGAIGVRRREVVPGGE